MSDDENRLEADTRNELRGDPCGENDCHCKLTTRRRSGAQPADSGTSSVWAPIAAFVAR